MSSSSMSPTRARAAVAVFVALASIGSGGCVSMYKAPEADDATATLKFFDRFGGPGRGHFYLWQSTQTCEQMKGEGHIAALDWMNGKEKQAVVATGQRRYLLAHRQALTGIAPAGGGETNFSSAFCRQLVSFVPEPGHTYRVEMGNLPQCDLEVLDLATQQPPATLQAHEVTGRCTMLGI
jgi:hypothetical protein